MSFISQDTIGEGQKKVMQLMELLSNNMRIKVISQQFHQLIKQNSGEMLDKKQLLVLICDTIDSDNNLCSNPADFDAFVDRYLLDEGLKGAGTAMSATQDIGDCYFKQGSTSGSEMTLAQVSTFVSMFINNRVDKLKKEMD